MIPILFISLAVSAWCKPLDYYDPMINEGLLEGDIMGIDPHIDRNAVPKDSQRWPGGVIPYVIDESLNPDKKLVMEAMKHIEDRSCIRFTPRTDQTDYLRLTKAYKGCWSFWGRLGIGEQLLSLGYGCENKGIYVHELMHAIGFEHEHIRSDRDDYLIIHCENVKEGEKHNFRKLLPHENRLLTDFDYDSIMLYGSHTFSISKYKKTMEAKDGRKLAEVYEKPGLAESDIKRIKMLYECE